MNNEDLITQALIEAFLVLETSSNDEIESGVAVRAMENISSSLLQMDHVGQARLRARIVRLGQAAGDDSYGDFCGALPDMIGLASPEAEA